MKLEEQSYQILDRGKIEIIGHTELLGLNKQIIRLKDKFYLEINEVLKSGKEISLFNHYNPINSDLIRSFKEKKDENNLALLAKIVGANNLGPILEGDSFSQVKVIEMNNIFFEDITLEQLNKSIAFKNGEKVSVANIINWLSEEFYSGRMSIEEIESYQRLFYRKIKSN